MITWNLIRAAGIGALLWASVTWGLISTTSIFGKRVSKATSVALHQVFGTLGVLLLAAHLVLLVTDRFMPFAPLDLVVPMRATYRPVGVTFGIASMFVMVFGVLATSWGRKVIGTKWWRRTHSLAVPAYVLAMAHGLMTGTDTQRPAMFWVYVATAGIQLFLLLMRAFTFGNRPQRASVPAGAPRRVPAPVLEAAEAEPRRSARTLSAAAISDGAIR
jgi:DMSO/TMAO reductase YedYZ heme-binding membrane subunit